MTIIELGYFLLKHGIGLDFLEQLVTDPKIDMELIIFRDIMFILHHIENVKQYEDLNDLIILSTSRRRGTPLMTFDKELIALQKEV